MTEPTILISPAMAVPSRVYGTFATQLRAAGFDVLIVGRRGFEPGDPPPSAVNDWSYADEIADLANAVAKLDAEPGERRPILVFGHSLGAQVAALMLSDTSDDAAARVDGFISLAGSIPHIDNYPPGNVAGQIAQEVLRVTDSQDHWPAPGFGAPGAKTLMREWATMVLTGVLPGNVAQRSQIATPTLAIRLQGDLLVSDAAADALESLVAPGSLTQWTYSSADCPPDGSLDHVRWVKTPQPVVTQIQLWWADRSSAAADT